MCVFFTTHINTPCHMVYGCAIITRERIVLTFFAVWSSTDLSQLSALSGRSVLHGRLRRSYVQRSAETAWCGPFSASGFEQKMATELNILIKASWNDCFPCSKDLQQKQRCQKRAALGQVILCFATASGSLSQSPPSWSGPSNQSPRLYT